MAMLERDLKTLRRCKLMDSSEFRVMLTELEKYHMELRTMKITGKNEKRELDLRPFLYDDGDTYEKPFFGVLSKMLYEVAMCKSLGKQKDDLRKIYQWFTANKKVLSANETKKSHFGENGSHDHASDEDSQKMIKVPKLRMRPRTAPPVESIKGAHSSYVTWNMAVNGKDGKRPGSGSSTRVRGFKSPRPPTAPSAHRRLPLSSSLIIKPAPGSKTPISSPRNYDGLSSRLYVGSSHLRRPGTAPPGYKNYKLHSGDDLDGLNSTFILRPGNSSTCPVSSPVSSPASSPKDTPRSHSPISAVYSPESQKEPSIKVHIRFPKQGSSQGDDDNPEVTVSENGHDGISGHVPEAMNLASREQIDQYMKQQQQQQELLEEQRELLELKLIQEQERKYLRENLVAQDQKDNGFIHQEESHGSQVVENGTIPMTNISAYDLSDSGLMSNYSTLLASQGSSSELDRLTVSDKKSPRRNVKSASGLPCGGVKVGDMLKLVTPVGQQLNLEREVLTSGIPSPGFRQPSLTVPVPKQQQRAVSAPPSSRRDVSRGSYQPMRTTTPDFKPELSPRDYTVHFPQHSDTGSETAQSPRTYKTSGPVTPDTVRYQWTDDGFGNKTFIKKLKSNQTPRAASAKIRPSSSSLAKSMNIESVSIRPSSRQLDTRTVASAMVVKHLGSSSSEKRTRDRFDEEVHSIPVTWEYCLDLEPPPDPTSYNLQYLSFVQPFGPPAAESQEPLYKTQTSNKENTKPVDVYEPIRGLDVRVEDDKNLVVQGMKLVLPSAGKDSSPPADDGPASERSTGSSVQSLTVRPLWATEELRSSSESLLSDVKRDQDDADSLSRPNSEISITIPDIREYAPDDNDAVYSAEKRVSSSQLYSMSIQKAPIYHGPAVDPVPNQMFACHHSGRTSPAGSVTSMDHSPSSRPRTPSPSRSTSPTPPRLSTPNGGRPRSACRPRSPSLRTPNRGSVSEHNFSTKDFSHFCWEDDHGLDEDLKRQREIWAAVSIQRIFRGHMARNYLKELRTKDKNRRQKAAIAVQSAFRGFMTRRRMMERRLREYVPSSSDLDWARKYKEELRRREEKRLSKNRNQLRLQSMENAKKEEQLKGVKASSHIQKIFSSEAGGPTKAQRSAAATSIQRFVKGWMTRRLYKKVKEKALKRTLDFNKFIKGYMEMMVRIQKRYGVENILRELNWSELMEYVEQLNKYETAFSKFAVDGVIKYEDLSLFFAELELSPSQREIDAAIQAITGESPGKRGLTKAEAVELVFQIYVPRGTGLKLADVRKSTWMNPLIDGQDVNSILTRKQLEQTSLAKVMKVMMDTQGESSEIRGLLRPSSAEPPRRRGKSDQKSPRSRSKSPNHRRGTAQDPGGVILAQYPLVRPKSAQSGRTGSRPGSAKPPVILAQYPLNRPDSSKSHTSRPGSSKSSRSSSPRSLK